MILVKHLEAKIINHFIAISDILTALSTCLNDKTDDFTFCACVQDKEQGVA